MMPPCKICKRKFFSDRSLKVHQAIMHNPYSKHNLKSSTRNKTTGKMTNAEFSLLQYLNSIEIKKDAIGNRLKITELGFTYQPMTMIVIGEINGGIALQFGTVHWQFRLSKEQAKVFIDFIQKNIKGDC
jgi:hypothetical protein